MKIMALLVSLIISNTAFAVEADLESEKVWKSFDDSEAISTAKSETLQTALPEKLFVLSLLNYEMRFEAATNPVMEARKPVNVGLGLRKDRHLGSIEYSRFGESSGNETYHVAREFQDILGWYRYSFFRSHGFRGTAGVGLGVYQEQITTSFYSVKQDLNSGAKWTAATGLGIEYEPIKYLALFIEGRLITGQNLDPNPNPDVLTRISVQF